MIIDIHTHIFPDEICRNREKFLDNEPAFQLLYNSPNARLINAAELLSAMDEDRIDISVIFGFPWKNLETSKYCNDYIMETVARYPDRFKGFCCLDPAHKDAAREVERCLDGGLTGVGELAFYQSGITSQNLDQLEPIMALCGSHGMPVLIHTNEPVGHLYPGKTPNTLSQIYELARRFRDNKLILAHWGGGIFFYLLLKKEVRETLANVYVDTAASPFLYRPEMYPLCVQLAGSEKILFGSDYPLLPARRYRKELEDAGLDADLQRSIMGGNAARLLGIEPT